MSAEIIEIRAKTDGLRAELEAISKQLGGIGTDAKKAGKDISGGISGAERAIDKARRNITQLGVTIKEQENLTSTWKKEVSELEKEYNRLGRSASRSGQQRKAEIDKLNAAINDNLSAVKRLKLEQTQQRDVVRAQQNNVREMKRQEKAIRDNKKETNSLNKAMGNLAKGVLAAFSVQAVSQFLKQAVLAADRAQGIEIAFNRVGASITELRETTRGTVSDVELMRATVNASNLGVPVEELSGLLGFAAARARESGESIDGMVNSIVTGLGRKSTRVLDNLGISAFALREELGETSLEAASVADVTRALNRVIERTDSTLEGNVSQVSRLGAAFDNLSVAIGKTISPATDAAAGRTATYFDDLASVMSSDTLSRWEKFGAIFSSITSGATGTTALEIYAQQARDAAEETEKFNTQLTLFQQSIDELNKTLSGEGELGIIEDLQEQIKNYDDLIKKATTESEIRELNYERLQRVTRLKRIEKDLTEQQLDFEIRRNAVLNERQNIEDFEDEGGLESFVGGFDWTDEYFSVLTSVEMEERESFKRREEAADEFYENALDQKMDSAEKQKEIDRKTSEFELQQRRQTAAATVETISNLFGTIGTLAGENAEITKALAIFEATLNAYRAISSVYADPTVPPLTKLPLAISIGALAFAQVAKIASTEPPSFFEGTDFLERGNNPKGKDTIPIRAHEGEAIIPTRENLKYPGLSKAWIKGDLEKYIKVNHIIPALEKQKQHQSKEEKALLSQVFKGSISSTFKDERIVNELRRSRKINEELALALLNSTRKNPYRA